MLVFLLSRFGIVSDGAMKRGRPYVIIGAFTLAMILTPPDVISQVMLAIPTWLLFETGLLMSQLLNNQDQQEI